MILNVHMCSRLVPRLAGRSVNTNDLVNVQVRALFVV